MSGNVWEWTVSLWDKKYPYSHDHEWNNETAGNDSARVVRGGSFIDLDDDSVRCADRHRNDPGNRFRNDGFRCCVSPNPTL
jgi:formylglycine-generating enzyme required for sulfatase activity